MSRYSVVAYLISSNYLFFVAFVCLVSAICYTLLSPQNAMYYYGLSSPENYIALIFCTLPFIALLAHMLHKGCRPLDQVAETCIQKQKKINLETREYYINQKVNIFRDIQKKSLYDTRLESFFSKHASIIYRILMFAAGVGPVVPIILSRNFGQHPVSYFFLMCTAYFVWIYSYFLPIAIQMTRTVMYIQKKHNIKLKLAYKKDVIMV